MISGLGLTLAFAGLWIAPIAWLCSRAHIWTRRAGMVLATVVASYCAGVALILVVGSAADREPIRLGGFLSVVTFVLIGIATVVSARRGRVKSS